MTPMRFIFLGVTLACFLAIGTAVTDEEFQAFSDLVKKKFDAFSDVVKEKFDKQETIFNQQAATIERLTDKVEQLTRMVMKPEQGLVQNSTLEERVELLEIQVSDLDQDVNFLLDEQVIQDERLFSLEQATDQINGHLVQVDEDIEGLQVRTLELDFRVTELEESGGSDGNSSISELEERVETLEGTAADHEARITSAESDLEDLEESIVEQETRLTAAEENIQGLQMTDISLDARITVLEENGGSSSNETVAFSAALTFVDMIAYQSPVEFNEILLNERNGYDSTTGVFTVPPGGDGLYYFSTYLLVQTGEIAWSDMRLNNDVICTAVGDHSNNGDLDYAQATCSAVVSVVEGDEIKVVLDGATDTTPFTWSAENLLNGFSGFRI